MANPNRDINLGKVGMNRDSHPSSLQPHEYTYALNSNMSDQHGNEYHLQNEHSNILCSKFKDGFRVIGFVRDDEIDRTYFFLTNPTTRESEIGYINMSLNVPNLEDIEADCDCDVVNKLSKPLEDQTPFETCQYYTLIADDCNKCLNFSIYYPIRKPIIKNEKCGKRIYWTDGINPQRYIDLSNLQQYQEVGYPSCGETPPSTCLDCEKLRIFPLYEKLCITPEDIETGGNLLEGHYEILAAYSDAVGNELTEYMGATQPIYIFNENNVNRIQPEALVRTNKGIRVFLDNLDSSYAYYKIAFIYTSAVDGSRSYFVEGVHSIDTQSIIITTEQNSQRIDLNDLLSVRTKYETARGLAASGGYLFQYGLTAPEEINLQPIVNLMGGLVQWSTFQHRSDIYNDPILAANYKGYQRDEVYPLGIRFLLDNGDCTPLTPFISRPSVIGEFDVIDNKDTQSVLDLGEDCDATNRQYRWQFYNTASEDGLCAGTTEEFDCQDVNDYYSCSDPAVQVEPTVMFQLTPEQYEKYTNLEEYVRRYKDEIVDPGSEFYNATLAALIETVGSNDCPLAISTPIFSEMDYDMITDEDCEGCKIDSTTECMIVSDVTSEDVTVNIVTPVAENNVSVSCDNVVDPTDENCDFSDAGLTVINRASTASFESCSSATSSVPDSVSIISGLFMGLDIQDVEADLETTIRSDNTGFFGNYKVNLHTKAIWFSHEFNDSEVKVMEFTKWTNCAYPDDLTNTKVRLSYYDGCPNPTDSTADITLSGTGGTANIVVGGVNYLATFNTDLTTTADDFVTTHAGAILAATGATVTASLGVLTFVGPTATFPSLSVVNVSVDLNGVVGPVTIVPGFDTPILVEEIDLASRHIFTLDPVDYPSGTVYIAMDAPINSTTSPVKYYIDTPCGCTALLVRATETESVDVTANSVTLDYVKEYFLTCKLKTPKLDDCEPQPYKKGQFAYWESINNYPDNEELYDSSQLMIESTDLDTIPALLKTRFESFYTDGVTGGVYDMKVETDFRCSPIRHFKMPDNNVAPFMSGDASCEAETVFYPLGINIDDSVVQAFLDIAVKNKLISQKQRDSIIGYEIFRGDRSVNKSVLANGYLYDMYNYPEEGSGREIWYANYPYNDLGNDELHFEDPDGISFISHPFDKVGNNRYSFHSPETEFDKPTLATELKINGVTYGCSNGYFSEVKDHPKWNILSNAAFGWATALAAAEALADFGVKYVEVTTQHPITSVGAGVAFGIAGAVEVVQNTISYRYQWLETFLGIIPRINYADYYTSTARYNQFKPVTDLGNHLRGLLSRRYLTPGRLSIREGNDETRVNHVGRESSVFLGLGQYDLQYAPFTLDNGIEFFDYDNSRFIETDTVDGAGNACNRGLSREVDSRVASLYSSMKNYVPAQYGDVGDIQWLPTGFCGRIGDSTDCRAIFGGDVFLAWHHLKRKLPLFVTNAMTLADETPFNYAFYKNIGYPRFFIDYLVSVTDLSASGLQFPQPNFEVSTDCEDDRTGTFTFYVSPEASFYLFYYGIPSLPLETTYNLATRYAGESKAEDFYPNYSAFIDWTQEVEVSIERDNVYKYYDTFSNRVTKKPFTVFPANYSKKLFECRRDLPNGVIYSEPDLSESDLTDPWLVYRPLNVHEFPNSSGDLTSIDGIESNQILTRFENKYQIDNVYNRFREGLQPTNVEVGGEGIFAQRPIDFYTTELGYAGTQHSALISCEYGHFWVDAKRGQVFQIDSRGQAVEISSMGKNGTPTNMSHWFKEHLPFKIMRGGISNLTYSDLDNNFNGLGITMVWDSRFKRIFVTKRDYIVKEAYRNKLVFQDGKILYNNLITDFSNREIYEDCSWTLSYSLKSNKWLSSYSFKPDYYIGFNNYFKSGLNVTTDASERGLWTHLLTNKSFQVFYGKRYPWTIELIQKESFTNRVVDSVNYWLDTRRYHNEYDFSEDRGVGFNKAYLFNHSNNSGLMELIPENRNDRSQFAQYPKYLSDRIEILATQNDKSWSFNHFFNRVRNEYNNAPIWLSDNNNLDGSINPRAIDYSATFKDRLRGDWFLTRLIQDKTSQYKFIHKFTFENQKLYR